MTAKPTARKRKPTVRRYQRFRIDVPFQGVPHGKLTRLVAKWRREADKWQKQLWRDCAQDMILRRCADELQRILNP